MVYIWSKNVSNIRNTIDWISTEATFHASTHDTFCNPDAWNSH
jgi:hypothetical protein